MDQRSNADEKLFSSLMGLLLHLMGSCQIVDEGKAPQLCIDALKSYSHRDVDNKH